MFKKIICLLCVVLLISCPLFSFAGSWVSNSRSLSSFPELNKIYFGLNASDDFFNSTGSGTLSYNTWNDNFGSLFLHLPIATSAASGEVINVSISGSGFSHSRLSGLTLYLIYQSENRMIIEPFAGTYSQDGGGSFSYTVNVVYNATKDVSFTRLAIGFSFSSVSAGGYFNLNDTSITWGYGNKTEYEQQQAVNNKLDQIANAGETEKSEANSGGNQGVSDITGAIPADNGGYISALTSLAEPLKYSGTDCHWTFPALYVPVIGNAVKTKIDLSPEQDIDLGSYCSMIPDNIMSVVRACTTIALLLFCVRELYSIVSYFLTLKGGSDSE